MTAPDWILLGRAATEGQVLPLGVDDPVVAARAVRRALARALRRATDVTTLVLASPEPPDTAILADFARRALGRHGSEVRLASVSAEGASADDGLAHAAAGHMTASGLLADGVGIAVGLGSDGTTVALCVQATRARPAP